MIKLIYKVVCCILILSISQATIVCASGPELSMVTLSPINNTASVSLTTDSKYKFMQPGNINSVVEFDPLDQQYILNRIQLDTFVNGFYSYSDPRVTYISSLTAAKATTTGSYSATTHESGQNESYSFGVTTSGFTRYNSGDSYELYSGGILTTATFPERVYYKAPAITETTVTVSPTAVTYNLVDAAGTGVSLLPNRHFSACAFENVASRSYTEQYILNQTLVAAPVTITSASVTRYNYHSGPTSYSWSTTNPNGFSFRYSTSYRGLHPVAYIYGLYYNETGFGPYGKPPYSLEAEAVTTLESTISNRTKTYKGMGYRLLPSASATTILLKSCSSTNFTLTSTNVSGLSGAEVIIDGGRSPRWTGGLL